MTTALRFAAEELKLGSRDVSMLEHLLASNPVAQEGHEALITKRDFLSSLSPTAIASSTREHLRQQHAIKGAVSQLATLRGTLRPPGDDTIEIQVVPLESITFVTDSKFIRYRFNTSFLELLRLIAQRHHLKALF
ncbi:hypothetical protein [Cupriavidus malaysiensis]|uniref:RepB family plasmid replication initiator protein n=1 Tax=Cupriavidus malaysiensis TaxID=367825 RepID=A0ABM6FGS4_9BURK|nr:hypothetical protein [Cupriavidus malaysiensis]AOZ11145.1 hypothetical protein BKK80_34895 [Cupriavidus malaysiensis]